MAISGKVAAFLKQTGNAIAFVDEATTANVDYTRYQITDTAKRYWDKNQAITVKKNGVIQTTGFTIEHLSGFIVFDTPLLGTDVVTVSGSYFATAQVGGAFNWSLDLETDTEEATTFASNGWKEFVATNNRFSGSADTYWVNGGQQADLGNELILIFYVDSGASQRRYEGYGIITGVSPETPSDSLVQESIDIQGSEKLFYREG